MLLMHSRLVDYIEQNIPVCAPGDTVYTPGLLAAAAGAAAGAVLAWLFLRSTPSLRNYDPDEHGAEWRGIRGVLIVVAAFVLLLPVAEVARLLNERFLFSTVAWRALNSTESVLYSPWWKGTLLFVAGVRGLTVVLAAAVAILLLLRRRMLRWAVFVYLGAVLLSGAVENFLYVQIFAEDGEAILQQHFDRTAGVLTLSLLLLPYLWVSKRVHTTFRN